jgi:hypothetical protein
MLLPWICGRVLRGEVCGTSLYGLCVWVWGLHD